MAETNTLRTLTDALSKTRTTKSRPLALSEVASKYLASSHSGKLGSVRGFSDTKLSGLHTKAETGELRFGSHSSRTTGTSSSGFKWSSILEQAGSGGLASAFGGGGGLLGGFGSLLSGLASLFGVGSNRTAPALVQFQLPTVQNQVISLGGMGGGFTSGESRPAAYTPGGIYGLQGQQGSGSVRFPANQHQKTQIIQTVKQALLNSSSLNDVIAEI
jgi:hypothetical protein